VDLVGLDNRETGYRDAPAAISGEEAAAIQAIAELVVEVDGQADRDEVSMLDAIAIEIYALADVAGTADSVQAAPIADELADQLRTFAGPLRGQPSAKLAFVAAYLIAVVDLQLAPEESNLLELLYDALELDRSEADEIAREACEIFGAGDGAVEL
jgi:uncharacterized tellurite resistance protein B-like protein